MLFQYRGMKSTSEKIIRHFAKWPRALFLTDGIGAMVTGICLFVILHHFNEYVGMPSAILTLLLVLAACLCAYSLLCFLFLKKNPVLFINIVSIANLLYCLLTMVLLIIYFPLLTFLGVAYFVGEIGIICGLVYIERKAASLITKNELNV
jgi:hypothetical protein